MKTLFIGLLFFTLTSLLTSCASTPLENMKKLSVGMDKATVLDIVGDPDKTFRQSGKDYWTYKYYEKDELKEGQVIIENGFVTYVLLQKPDEQTIAPKNFKEYKGNVEQKRKNYQKQFKTLDD